KQRLDDFFYEKRRAVGLGDDLLFDRGETLVIAEKDREQFRDFCLAERGQVERGVIAPLLPLGVVLGPVIHQQQKSRICHTVTERVQKRLRFAIDPLHVLEDKQHRLIETLAQEEALYRLPGAATAQLGVQAL